MKKQILTTLAVASLTMSFSLMAEAQFPDCMKTRLGCLDESGPIIPIDQPTLIQVGLNVKIKCEATTADGQSFVASVDIVKNVMAQEFQILDYHLIPGTYGDFSVSLSPKESSDVLSSYIYGSADKADAKALENGSGLSIHAFDEYMTRIGTNSTTIELEFSSTNNLQPLKLLSAYYNHVQAKFGQKVPPVVTTKQLTFTASNCAYY